MKNKITFLFLAILILPLFLNLVSADLGPKPTVDIEIFYEEKKISEEGVKAVMLECWTKTGYIPRDNETKSHFEPLYSLSEYDPVKKCYWKPAEFAWGGDCQNSKCHFSYFPPSEFKLAVYIPSLNKIFISNEISRRNFHSTYVANLNPDGSAKIYETTSILNQDIFKLFILALVITLIIELLTSLIYVSKTKLPKKNFN